MGSSKSLSVSRVRACMVGIITLTVLSLGGHVRGASMLMSTDGMSSSNNSKAIALGNTVTTAALSSIVSSPVPNLNNFDAVWTNPNLGASKTWAVDNPTEIRFIVSHADCSQGMSSTFEFFVSGTSVGLYSSTQGCECNINPLVVTLNDSATLSLIKPIGCTPVGMTLNDPTFELALGYVRVEIDRAESGTEIFCLVDYLPGGNCEDRDLCDGVEFPGTSSYSNILNCSDPLVVTPTEGLSSSGTEGGPFTPPNKIYTLTNTGINPVAWAVTVTAPWLSAEPSSGTLSPAETDLVTVSLNAQANTLVPGEYNDLITFRNVTSGFNQTREVHLQVNRLSGEIEVADSIPPIDDFNMPFGDAILGLSRTEHVTITNTDPHYTLIINDISLDKKYLEDFNDGLAQNWEPTVSSHWTVLSGEYRASVSTSTTSMQSVYKGESWQNCSAQVKIRRTGDMGSAARLVVRASDDFVATSYQGRAYAVGTSGYGDYYVGKYTPGTFTFIQGWTFSPYLNTGTVPNIIIINITGAKIDVYFNDYLAWTSTDATISTTGRIGMVTYSGYSPYTISYFDDVQVNELLPAEQTISSHQQWYNEHPYDGGSPDESPQDWTPPPYPGEGEILVPASPSAAAFRLEYLPPLPAAILPGENIVFDVNFSPLELKNYRSSLVIISNDSDEPEIMLQLGGTGIEDYLEITPDANLAFAGHPGGPFVPSTIIYTLTNNGLISIDWSAEPNVTWLTISAGSGTLNPGTSTTVIASPNAQADSMPMGQYANCVRFTNVTTTKIHDRGILLNVYTDPKMRVQPASIALSILQGESGTANLTIENTGDGDLNFSLSSRQTGFAPQHQPSPTAASLSDNSDVSISVPENHDFNVPADVPFAEDRILVRFKPKADGKHRDQKDKQQVLDSFGGGQIKRNFKLQPDLGVVALPPGLNVRDALKTFNGKKKEILYAEPDYQLTLFSNFPNDTYFTYLWGMHNTGQTGGVNDADIDAPEAWDINTNGSNIIVAVIDTGVDYTHPDLAANMWVNTAEKNGSPGVDDDGNGYIDDIYGYDFYNRDGNPMDDHGHGTHCSGTIGAAGNNGQGVAGVCWNAKIMAVKFLSSGGYGYDSDAIDSIEYAVQMGAKVASNSWGGGSYDQALKDTINAAGAAGMLFVAAAGNDYGSNNDVYPAYPASYDCANIISVLSTDHYDAMSSFSNYGPISVDLGAPGSSIYSCLPGGQYTYMSGTSMATPHVSGACALVWSVCPYLSSAAIKDIILQTTDPLPSLAGLCVSGGRLNLSNAIAEAGTAWLEFDPAGGTVAARSSQNVLVTFYADRPAGTYEGEIVVSSNDPFYLQVSVPATMTVEPVDYLTELFDATDPNQNDLAYKTLVFTPCGSSCYSLCTKEADELPVDQAGGTVVSLDDDDYAAITLPEGKIPFFGELYDTFYIGSNGYISFLSGDLSFMEGLEDHFDLPRISALFDDLDPSSGGQISYKESHDGVVVTFEGVPEYGSSTGNTFQIDMRFGGKIIVTFLDVAIQDGLAGLSDGRGMPDYFVMCDLSEYGICNFVADVTGDEAVDFHDFAVFAQCEQQQYKDIVTETVREQFDATSYSNNDGTSDWEGLWRESGEADGPAAGIVQVVAKHSGGYLSFNPPNKGIQTAYSLVRDANLAGAITATLTFDYAFENKPGQLSAQVSSDGGTMWQTLAVYNSTSGNGLAVFNITPYVGAGTSVRFELTSGSIMYAHLDNVQLEYDIISWASPCAECNFDGNQIIDLGDLAILAEHWLD